MVKDLASQRHVDVLPKQQFNNLSSWRWLVFCAYPMTETIRVGSTAAD